MSLKNNKTIGRKYIYRNNVVVEVVGFDEEDAELIKVTHDFDGWFLAVKSELKRTSQKNKVGDEPC